MPVSMLLRMIYFHFSLDLISYQLFKRNNSYDKPHRIIGKALLHRCDALIRKNKQGVIMPRVACLGRCSVQIRPEHVTVDYCVLFMRQPEL